MDKVNVAIMGVRGRGRSHAESFASFPDVNVAYLIDVDEASFTEAARIVETKTGRKPRMIGDVRRALDDKDLHALIVSTPDHWHAPATLLACAAGKDVYVEKPAAHNIKESRMMVDAARKHKRIVQHGTQARSRSNTIRGIEYAQSGKIGAVRMTKAWNVQRRKDIGHKPDATPPAGVDYETWIGPALFLPYRANRFHYDWHWHWNFGTGDMGNDGAHQVDQARWALGVDYPTEVSGMGAKLYFDDDQQTPDTMMITFNYPGNKMMVFEQRIWNPYRMDGVDNGIAVYGSEGMVQIGRWKDGSGFKVFDRKGDLVVFDKDGRGDSSHAANFIECVKSRKSPNAEIEIGHQTTVHCLLGNIVARTGRSIRFDAKSEKIIGDAEASKLLGREYRRHWATPA